MSHASPHSSQAAAVLGGGRGGGGGGGGGGGAAVLGGARRSRILVSERERDVLFMGTVLSSRFVCCLWVR